MENKADSISKVLPTALFEQLQDWLAWLKENHNTSPGLWLQLAKKDSGVQSVTYPEAVEGALCYGWIDGQKKAHDAQYWLQKFTPRADKSIWSNINKTKALALIKSGKMQPAGLKAIERAKANGRWDAAYESASKSAVPDDFQAMLDNNVRARKFFETLDSANRYAVLFRIQTSKNPETRAKKMLRLVQMLKRHEKVHP